MNQTFNPTRFFKYAQYNLIINKNGYLYSLTGFCSAMLLTQISLLSFSSGWHRNQWSAFYLVSLAIFGIIFFGKSFSALRKKESAINFMILPASTFEKFIYEFLSKILITLIIYGVLFPIIADLSAFLAQFINSDNTIKYFSYADLIDKPIEYIRLIVFLYILAFSLIFAGTTAFKKRPVLMTFIFLGLVAISTIGYLYIISEKLNLNNGISYTLRTQFYNDNKLLTAFTCAMAITSIISWIYAYFKIKEKEV